MKNLKEFVSENKIFVVAHRGSSGTAPENTIAAFREAVDSGAQMLETDIQLTADGQIITFHDKVLNRITGSSGFIKDLKLEDLKNLNAGSWFSPEFSGEHIPLLSELLEVIKNKAYLNIEIKKIEPERMTFLLENLLEQLDLFDYRDKILFSSFYYDVLKSLKEIDSNLPTAAIRIPKDKTLPSQIAEKIGCQGFVCSLEEINEEINADIVKNNIYVGVYSVDTKEQLEYVLQYKVQAIVSNFPGRIIQELKSFDNE